ncbi:MAG: hypothetical protein H7196_02625 [candidate division SR1 bacterium]|nr:hypothetical protein [candidate division SR1 bacterium]
MQLPKLNKNFHLETLRRKGIFTLTTYILTLLLSRLIVFLIEQDVDIPFLGYNIVKGYHIHHFTYGIILLVVISFATLFLNVTRFNRSLYFLYGLALGLVFDEFGIWLKLDPTYNQTISYIACSVVAIFLVFTLFLESWFPKIFEEYGE